MRLAGMTIGSHTVRHRVLSQLSKEECASELSDSQRVLSDMLNSSVSILAYPVGGRTSFTRETQDLAKAAGYEAAFSMYGGTNSAQIKDIFDVRRICMDGLPKSRFQVQNAIGRISGVYWP